MLWRILGRNKNSALLSAGNATFSVQGKSEKCIVVQHGEVVGEYDSVEAAVDSLVPHEKEHFVEAGNILGGGVAYQFGGGAYRFKWVRSTMLFEDGSIFCPKSGVTTRPVELVEEPIGESVRQETDSGELTPAGWPW